VVSHPFAQPTLKAPGLTSARKNPALSAPHHREVLGEVLDEDIWTVSRLSASLQQGGGPCLANKTRSKSPTQQRENAESR
jgi:hypothetical protein